MKKVISIYVYWFATCTIEVLFGEDNWEKVTSSEGEDEREVI